MCSVFTPSWPLLHGETVPWFHSGSTGAKRCVNVPWYLGLAHAAFLHECFSISQTLVALLQPDASRKQSRGIYVYTAAFKPVITSTARVWLKFNDRQVQKPQRCLSTAFQSRTNGKTALGWFLSKDCVV